MQTKTERIDGSQLRLAERHHATVMHPIEWRSQHVSHPEWVSGTPSMAYSDWPFGHLLLDAHGRILDLNRMARKILDREAGLTIHLNRMSAMRPSDAQYFARLLADVACGRAARTEWMSMGPMLRVRFGAVTSPHANNSKMPGACIVADVVDVTLRREGIEQLVDIVGGLTPTQKRLIVSLLMGLGLQDCANELGVSINTAKSHLHQIFRRQGVKRLPDLLLMYTLPFTVVPQL